MKLLIITAIGLAALDAGIRHWRSSAPVSDTPVWSLEVAEEDWGNTEGIRRAVEVYGADRGTEMKLQGELGEEITVFYFEWDEVAAGPIMDIAGHAPEECNVIAGLPFVSGHPPQDFKLSDDVSLQFDSTEFQTPGGETAFVFKSVWLCGFGGWDFRQGQDRLERLERSFLTGRGAARVLQVGLIGADSEIDGWNTVRNTAANKIRIN